MKQSEQSLGYELRIGNHYKYKELNDPIEYPCTLINILHDGHNVVYEFKHDNSRAIGATIHPEKLLP